MWSLSLSLTVGCSVRAESPQSQKQSNVAPAPGSRSTRSKTAADQPAKCSDSEKCEDLGCNGTATTRQATITFGDNGIVDATDTICACVGDTIEWTYDNRSKQHNKDVYIKDLDSFLMAGGDCMTKKTALKDSKDKKGKCVVKAVLANGCKGYEIHGTHYKDPEVEVQGGDKGRGSPTPPPSPIP
jgi:hypothetical protein